MLRPSYLPLTQETAMKLLGFISPFDTINFGPTTGNRTLLRYKTNESFTDMFVSEDGKEQRKIKRKDLREKEMKGIARGQR